MSALKYVGQGEWLPGVPARDLTPEEAAEYPQAAKSALYVTGDGSGKALPPLPESAYPPGAKPLPKTRKRKPSTETGKE